MFITCAFEGHFRFRTLHQSLTSAYGNSVKGDALSIFADFWWNNHKSKNYNKLKIEIFRAIIDLNTV